MLAYRPDSHRTGNGGLNRDQPRRQPAGDQPAGEPPELRATSRGLRSLTAMLNAQPPEPDVFDLAPKVELHLHVEGAIPHDAMWELVCRHGGDPNVPTRESLVATLAYRDFLHFIDVWTWMTNFIRTPSDFSMLAEAVARSLAAQNIVYAEASVSPSDYRRHGITPQEAMVATRRGIEQAGGPHMGLIVDVVRETGPLMAMRTLESIIEVMDEAGIVGITIGGVEDVHPPEPFADVYRRAADVGLGLTAHAGEAAGPKSVWGALDALGVQRIGHGVRSVEDPALLERLVAEQVPLEVCPTSNMRTGVSASWEDHAIATLLDAGATVTVSTDDPAYFHCDLAGELREVSTRFGLGAATARDLTLTAVDASFLAPGDKQRLAAEVSTWWTGRLTGGAASSPR